MGGYLYYLLLLPTLIFTVWAQFNVNGTFNKYSKIRCSNGFTGLDAANEVLRLNGITNVRIERISGSLTDHYDPKDNVIRLSDSVYDSNSIAAIGVAAHEAGHAVQHAQNYFPIKVRMAIIPMTQIGSKLAMPIFFMGLIFTSFGFLTDVGILLFSLSVLFQLVTLPVEFNASKRAMKSIREANLLGDDEAKLARKTLTAAAMTYVAALASALLSLLRLISIANSRNRR